MLPDGLRVLAARDFAAEIVSSSLSVAARALAMIAGYLLKERISDVGILTDALSLIAASETVLDPTIVAQLMGRQRRNNPFRRLTEREREVLALVAEGRSNKGVALQLFVTERTIEAHLTQIFAKLGLSGSNLQHRRVLAVATFLRS